jgi:hypothetical protein
MLHTFRRGRIAGGLTGAGYTAGGETNSAALMSLRKDSVTGQLQHPRLLQYWGKVYLFKRKLYFYRLKIRATAGKQ